MQYAVSILLLCLPPIVLTGLIGGTLYWARAFRRSFGAHNPLTRGAILVAALFMFTHAGYYGAPILFAIGRSTLALWLVTPVALVALAAFAWFIICSASSMSLDARLKFHRLSLIATALLATYLLPVIVLSINLSASRSI